jgi:hypothetical protein
MDLSRMRGAQKGNAVSTSRKNGGRGWYSNSGARYLNGSKAGLSALRRFNWAYREIRDDRGNLLGYGIPPETDKRKPRAQAAGSTSGFLYVHEDRNRARRRELSREYSITGTMRGTNRPALAEQLTAVDIILTHKGAQ